jgi:hypothetical protein
LVVAQTRLTHPPPVQQVVGEPGWQTLPAPHALHVWFSQLSPFLTV